MWWERWADRGERCGRRLSRLAETAGRGLSTCTAPPPSSVVSRSVGVALETLLCVVFVLIGGVPVGGVAPLRVVVGGLVLRRVLLGRLVAVVQPVRGGALVVVLRRAVVLVPVPVVVPVVVLVGVDPALLGTIAVLVGPLVLVVTGAAPLGPVVLRVRSAVPPALAVPVGRLLDVVPVRCPVPAAGLLCACLLYTSPSPRDRS